MINFTADIIILTIGNDAVFVIITLIHFAPIGRKSFEDSMAIDKTKTQKILDKLEREGKKTPLEFFLAVMHSKQTTIGLRLEAAKAAAPYVHRKQPNEVVQSGEVTVIQPFIPSRGQLAEDFEDELDEL